MSITVWATCMEPHLIHAFWDINLMNIHNVLPKSPTLSCAIFMCYVPTPYRPESIDTFVPRNILLLIQWVNYAFWYNDDDKWLIQWYSGVDTMIVHIHVWWELKWMIQWWYDVVGSIIWGWLYFPVDSHWGDLCHIPFLLHSYAKIHPLHDHMCNALWWSKYIVYGMKSLHILIAILGIQMACTCKGPRYNSAILRRQQCDTWIIQSKFNYEFW
jgi:hypothetical protein